MTTRLLCAGVAALGLVLLAAAPAGAAAATADVKVELRGDVSGGRPEVRLWVNGNEVQPGGVLAIETKEQGPAGTTEGKPGGERPSAQAFLGVRVAPLDQRARDKARVETGALVANVMPDSPAAKAGLEEGDVIISFNGRSVESPEQLLDQIRQFRPGDKVKLAWQRAGKQMAEGVVLGAYAEGGKRPEGGEAPKEPAKGEAFLGVMASPLTEETKEYAGTDRGVLIRSITDDSPAAKAGLQAGDVIVSMDGKEVNSPGELVDRVRSHRPGEAIRVVYRRGGKRQEVTVTLAERPGEKGGKRPGLPLFEMPEDWLRRLPDLRQYLEKIRPDIEEWAKRWGEEHPGAVPPPSAGPRTGPRAEPYDMGKDMGRILERLDRIENRLSEIEKRLDRLEKR
jgi:membrane-associated protease RseP (regulator of RpoE activity)